MNHGVYVPALLDWTVGGLALFRGVLPRGGVLGRPPVCRIFLSGALCASALLRLAPVRQVGTPRWGYHLTRLNSCVPSD